MTKEKQESIFPKKFIVEPYETITYRFEVEAEDGWEAQEKAVQTLIDWDGNNTEYIIKRSNRSCNRITNEKGTTSKYSHFPI